MTPIRFNAPWSSSLKRLTVTLVTVLILISASGFFWRSAFANYRIALPVALLLVAALRIVRGYELDEKELVVRRLGWSTRLPIKELKSVDGRSEILKNSIPLLSYGGFFSYVGWYWNSEWRLLRVLATDPSRAVVLTFEKYRVVITPHDPQQFIVRARTILQTKDSPV